ncbi:hypothetical protein OHS18_11850 [Amycolatopsis sp. NBC_00355]
MSHTGTGSAEAVVDTSARHHGAVQGDADRGGDRAGEQADAAHRGDDHDDGLLR